MTEATFMVQDIDVYGLQQDRTSLVCIDASIARRVDFVERGLFMRNPTTVDEYMLSPFLYGRLDEYVIRIVENLVPA